MYEFSNKEIKEKFKKTQYGKKTNKMLIVSIIASSLLFLFSVISYFVIAHDKILLTAAEDIFLNILFGITCVSIIITCYFDGKRDGAIEQYKTTKK